MSLDVATRYPRRLAGVVSMSGYLSEPEHLLIKKGSDLSGLPILLTHGVNDDTLPVEGSRRAETLLRQAGCHVKLFEYQAGHQIAPDAVAMIRAFIWGLFEPGGHGS